MSGDRQGQCAPSDDIAALRARITALEAANARQTRELAALVRLAESRRAGGGNTGRVGRRLRGAGRAATARLTGVSDRLRLGPIEARLRAWLSRHPRLKASVRRIALRLGLLE